VCEKPINDPRQVCIEISRKKYAAQRVRGIGGIHEEKPDQGRNITEDKSFSGDLEGVAALMRGFFHR